MRVLQIEKILSGRYKSSYQIEDERRYQRRCGNGKNPRPKDSSGDSPPHRRESLRGADADYRSSNGMCGAHWNSIERGPDQGERGGALGTEPSNWAQLCNLRTHGVDDAPSAKVSSHGNGKIGPEDHGPVKASPVAGHLCFRDQSTGIESTDYNAHCLLRVIAAMSKTHAGRGD